MSADALQVYAGLETLTGAAGPCERPGSSTGFSPSCPSTPASAPGQYAELAHAEIDGLLADGRRPIVVGGTGLYLRAALTELSLRPPPAEGLRERWTAELERAGPAGAARPARPARALGGRARSTRPTASASCARSSSSTPASSSPPTASQSCGRRRAPSRPSRRAGHGARAALRRASTPASTRWSPPGSSRRSAAAAAAGASATARKALGFAELLTGDVEAMKRRTRNYARRQLTWMRKLAARARLDVTDREPAGRGRARSPVTGAAGSGQRRERIEQDRRQRHPGDPQGDAPPVGARAGRPDAWRRGRGPASR